MSIRQIQQMGNQFFIHSMDCALIRYLLLQGKRCQIMTFSSRGDQQKPCRHSILGQINNGLFIPSIRKNCVFSIAFFYCFR